MGVWSGQLKTKEEQAANARRLEMERENARLKFLAELWIKGNKYQMTTFGDWNTDAAVTAEFGFWLDRTTGERLPVPYYIRMIVEGK